MQICALDDAGFFTGDARDIGELDPCPKGWVIIDAPVLAEGEAARYAGGQWIVEQDAIRTLRAFAARKAAMMDAVRAKRWSVETGGLTLNGVTIRTDEVSQSKITGGVNLFERDETLTAIDWEAQPGVWIEVDGPTMTAIGVAVGRHVQACFSRARQLMTAITEAADEAALDAIDINAGWPA